MDPQFQQYVRTQFGIIEKILRRGQLHFAFGVGPVTNKTKGKTMLELTITNEQKVNVQLHPVTGAGNPAPVDGAPVWSVVSGNSTVTPATDGMTADLISSDDPGDTIFMVSADADLGSGVVTISDTITLHVNHALAASLGLTASDPVNK